MNISLLCQLNNIASDCFPFINDPQPCVIIHVRELAKPDFWHMVDSRYVFPGRGEIFLGDDAGNAVITKRCEKLVVHRFDQRMYKKLKVVLAPQNAL